MADFQYILASPSEAHNAVNKDLVDTTANQQLRVLTITAPRGNGHEYAFADFPFSSNAQVILNPHKPIRVRIQKNGAVI